MSGFWEVQAADAAAAEEMAALAGREIPNAWSASSIRNQLRRSGNAAWVARAGPRLLGFVWVERVLDELTILSMAVESKSRRRGIAREMLSTAISRASDAGVNVVHLEFRASNSGARALYEGLGFEPVGKRPGYYEGREDAVLMSLKLE